VTVLADPLAVPDDRVAVRIDGHEVTRAQLAASVTAWAGRLSDHGLSAGGTLLLRVAPSLTYLSALLAGWRLDAQVLLVDHRLTDAESDACLARFRPQVSVVSAPAGRWSRS
jgi:acyl-CoA synthetase (AMP-forming)/AMP-acid ligase II